MNQNPKLHRVKLTCPVCKADKLTLDEEIAGKCSLCGQEFEADTTCKNNHYICHICRQKAAREEIIRYCLANKQTDPYSLMLELMKLPDTAMHGPEHHLLFPAALLTSLCNAKGRTDLAVLLEEANNRSIQVPGGACGSWGICGAAIGAGIFSSIIAESSPYAEKEWKSCGQLTSRCASAISKQGGPRCCKRDSYTALKEAIPYCNKRFKTNFTIPGPIKCQFYIGNKECKGKKCQFFPLP